MSLLRVHPGARYLSLCRKWGGSAHLCQPGEGRPCFSRALPRVSAWSATQHDLTNPAAIASPPGGPASPGPFPRLCALTTIRRIGTISPLAPNHRHRQRDSSDESRICPVLAARLREKLWSSPPTGEGVRALSVGSRHRALADGTGRDGTRRHGGEPMARRDHPRRRRPTARAEGRRYGRGPTARDGTQRHETGPDGTRRDPVTPPGSRPCASVVDRISGVE